MKRYFPAFTHLKALPDLHKMFEEQGTPEYFSPGDYLLPLDSAISKAFLVFSGHGVFIYEQDQGLSRSCGILPPGGLAGFGPQMPRRPREISVMCLEPIIAKSVPYPGLRHYYESDPRQHCIMLQHFLDTVTNLYTTILFQTTLNLPQRLAYFLRAYSENLDLAPDAEGFIDLPLRLTHEQLGAIISATRVTTTLLLNHLERLEALEQTKFGLRYAAWLTEADFILDELKKRHWAVVRKK